MVLAPCIRALPPFFPSVCMRCILIHYDLRIALRSKPNSCFTDSEFAPLLRWSLNWRSLVQGLIPSDSKFSVVQIRYRSQHVWRIIRILCTSNSSELIVAIWKMLAFPNFPGAFQPFVNPSLLSSWRTWSALAQNFVTELAYTCKSSLYMLFKNKHGESWVHTVCMNIEDHVSRCDALSRNPSNNRSMKGTVWTIDYSWAYDGKCDVCRMRWWATVVQNFLLA